MISSVELTPEHLSAAAAKQSEHAQTTEQSSGWFWDGAHNDVVKRQTVAPTEEKVV